MNPSPPSCQICGELLREMDHYGEPTGLWGCWVHESDVIPWAEHHNGTWTISVSPGGIPRQPITGSSNVTIVRKGGWGA